MKEKLKTVIFDMDGLMFDTETMYYQANQKAADELGLPFTYDYYAKYIGISDEEFFASMYLEFKDDEKVDAFIKNSQTYLFQQIETTGILVKPGLIELLEFLHERGVNKVVASSSIQSMVQMCLDSANVAHYFDEVVSGDQVKLAKPNPEIFEKAWGLFDGKKEETVILEDSLNGIRAAYDAGISVIMVPDLFEPNEETKEKTVAVKSDLLEAKNYLQKNWILNN